MDECEMDQCECEAEWEAEAMNFEFYMDEQSHFFKPPYKPEPDWPGGWVTVA
jgi:hypothetical protein